MSPAGKGMTSLFRIDKTLISYDRSDTAYTSVGAALRPAHRQPGMAVTGEDGLRARARDELEAQLQEKLAETEKIAGALLADAEEKARQIVSCAQAEASGIKEKAEEKGYSDGAQKAEKEMQARFEQQTEVLQNIIMQIGEAREGMIDELEDEIISLVLDTAKKVINIELEKNDKVFVDVIQNALSQIKREGKIVIRVGQDDYARFFSSGSAEFILGNERIRTTVIDEPLYEKGDCVIESEGETVNAGISSQLKYIELAFRSEESHIA